VISPEESVTRFQRKETGLPRWWIGGPWQQVFDVISKLYDQVAAIQDDVALIKRQILKDVPITDQDISDLNAAAAEIRDIDKKEN
jgi:hypothetical protein